MRSKNSTRTARGLCNLLPAQVNAQDYSDAQDAAVLKVATIRRLSLGIHGCNRMFQCNLRASRKMGFPFN